MNASQAVAPSNNRLIKAMNAPAAFTCCRMRMVGEAYTMVRVCRGKTFPSSRPRIGQARNSQGVIGNARPCEIPMLVRSGLQFEPVGPVFRARQHSAAVGPDRELVGMIGVDRFGQQAVVEVNVAVGVFGVAHQGGHAHGVSLHARRRAKPANASR